MIIKLNEDGTPVAETPAATTTETQTADDQQAITELSPDDAFSQAFAEFSKEVDADEVKPAAKPASTPAVTSDNQDAAAAAAAAAAAKPAEGEGGTDDATAKAAADAAAAAEAAKKPVDDPIKRLADTLSERLAQQPPAAQPQQKPAEKPPAYTAAETGVLNKYAEDYPEIMQAERLIRRTEYSQVIEYTLGEVAKVLAPYMRQQQEIAQNLHLQALQKNVEGYSDELVDQVGEWVNKQPDYLQTAYKAVIENGSDQQIADLVTRFRKETGVAAPGKTQETPAPTVTQQAKTELPAQAKKAAAALAPVSVKRSATITNAGPVDFDDAFSVAAKELAD